MLKKIPSITFVSKVYYYDLLMAMPGPNIDFIGPQEDLNFAAANLHAQFKIIMIRGAHTSQGIT